MKSTEVIWLLLMCACSSQFGFGSPPAAQWSQFRGPNSSGVASGKHALPDELSELTLRWKVAVLPGVSSPCVWNDHVFITGVDEQERLVTVCFNLSTGDETWRRTAPRVELSKTHPAGSPAAPTPTTDGSRVYVYFGDSGVFCYDFDGHEVWNKPIAAPINRHGAGSSPVLVDDQLILCCDQGAVFRSQGSYLIALNKFSGDEIWRAERPLSSAGWTTPVVVSSSEGKSEVVVLGRRLIAYDPKTGKENWWVDGFMDYSITTPVVSNGIVYATTAAGGFEADHRIPFPTFDHLVEENDTNGDGRLQRQEIPADMVVYQGDTTGVSGDGITGRSAFKMFDADNDGNLEKQEWDGALETWNQMKNVMVAIKSGSTGEATESQIVWRRDRQLPEVPSPLLLDGSLYLVKNGGVVSCLDSATGKTNYRKRLGVSGNIFASPVAGDGKIFVCTDRGDVAVVASGEKYRLVSRSDLDEPIIATPAISKGNVLVRTSRHLICFSTSESN